MVDFKMVDWLVYLKTRRKETSHFEAVARLLAEHIESVWEEPDPEEHTDMALESVAVLGRRFDPAVRRVIAHAAARKKQSAVKLLEAQDGSVRAPPGSSSTATSAKRRLSKAERYRRKRLGSAYKTHIHSKIEAAQYFLSTRAEFTGCKKLEINNDDTRFPSTLGMVRDHGAGIAMNKSSGVTAVVTPLVSLGEILFNRVGK